LLVLNQHRSGSGTHEKPHFYASHPYENPSDERGSSSVSDEQLQTATQGRNSGGLLTEDGVGGVEGGLVDGRVADEPLGVGEGDAGRREAIALVVGDDLATVVAPHGHALPRSMPTAGPSLFEAAAISLREVCAACGECGRETLVVL